MIEHRERAICICYLRSLIAPLLGAYQKPHTYFNSNILNQMEIQFIYSISKCASLFATTPLQFEYTLHEDQKISAYSCIYIYFTITHQQIFDGKCSICVQLNLLNDTKTELLLKPHQRLQNKNVINTSRGCAFLCYMKPTVPASQQYYFRVCTIYYCHVWWRQFIFFVKKPEL